MIAKKITIEPVTRIEGHARITIHLNESGEVEKTYLHVDEFRGLEKFSEGRPYFEMPQITQRICGICPVSHHLASVKACDDVAGLTPPRPAELLRELMHMAQTVQSHGMHFFHLASPDLLFGFDAEPEKRNVFEIIKQNPELAKKAVQLRSYGQKIIEILGKKRVHPNFAVPGGVNSPLETKDRDDIALKLDEQITVAKLAIGIGKDWIEKNYDLTLKFASFSTGYMGLTNDQAQLQLYNGDIQLTDSKGDHLSRFKANDYLDYIGEHVEEWSFLKFPYFKKLGWEKGAYRVGPLARLNVAKNINTHSAQEEFKKFKQIANGKPVEGSLFYHYARLIELMYALERIRELIEDKDILSKDIRACDKSIITGHGVGVIEAPRGTLIHDYSTDENGILTRVNLIVATGHNNRAMNEATKSVAKMFINGKDLTEGMLNRLESAVRCYDPCFSCSTHAIGQMAMKIILVEADGTILDEKIR